MRNFSKSQCSVDGIGVVMCSYFLVLLRTLAADVSRILVRKYIGSLQIYCFIPLQSLHRFLYHLDLQPTLFLSSQLLHCPLLPSVYTRAHCFASVPDPLWQHIQSLVFMYVKNSILYSPAIAIGLKKLCQEGKSFYRLSYNFFFFLFVKKKETKTGCLPIKEQRSKCFTPFKIANRSMALIQGDIVKERLAFLLDFQMCDTAFRKVLKASERKSQNLIT